MATPRSYTLVWSRGDTVLDRGVRERGFCTTSVRLSWPERDQAEVAAEEDLYPQVGPNGDVWASAFDSAIHGGARQSRRHEIPRRIHILGVGNVGLFLAHSLAGIPNPPPITLLSHRKGSQRSWKEAGERIKVVTDGSSQSRHGFDLEYVPPISSMSSSTPNPENASFNHHPGSLQEPITSDVVEDIELENTADSHMDETHPPLVQGDDAIIWNLVVSVKISTTIQALSKVAHRLCRDSSILFLQNGMGMLDEVNEKLFPNVETRPNYIVGVVSHGVKRLEHYAVEHAGFGTIAIGILPRKPAESFRFPDSARYLLRTLTRTPILAAVAFPPTDLLQQQLDKLAVNCIINPLTAIFDCTNGELLNQFSVTRIMRLLLAEVSLVIRSLPELDGVPNKNLRYDPQRLEAMVVVVATRTAKNVSSMLHDVRQHTKTEIDYINGYVVRRGEELGIKCVLNYMLLQMVKARGNMVQQRDDDTLPLDLQDSLVAYPKVTKGK